MSKTGGTNVESGWGCVIIDGWDNGVEQRYVHNALGIYNHVFGIELISFLDIL